MGEEIIDNTADEFDLAFGVAVGGGETVDEGATGEGTTGERATGEGVTGEGTTSDGATAEGTTAEGTTAEGTTAEGTTAEGTTGEGKIDPAVAAKAQADVAAKAEAERLAAEAKVKEKADADAEAARLQAEAVSREALTPEEQAALKEVETNFPDTALALKAVERVAFTKAENAFNAKLKQIEERFEQKLGQLSTDFAPAIATAHTVARSAHETEILKGHADAYTILPEVEKWVDKHPSFLKDAYNAVLDKGSAAQIVELFNIFKKESGSVKGPPTSPTPEETAQKAARDKKLQSLEGVRSRQAAQKGGIDEDDFESAFKAAANS